MAKSKGRFKQRYLLATGEPYTFPDGVLWMMNRQQHVMKYPRILEFENGQAPQYRLILERINPKWRRK